jgi:hypothetical protein
VVLALVLVLGGCAAPPGAAQSPAPAATLSPSAVVSSPAADGSRAVVAAALADAATHLGLGANDVRVQQVVPREWPDSSLGCPSPGAMYLQVITPGYLVVVVGGGKTLEYHANMDGHVVLCSET